MTKYYKFLDPDGVARNGGIGTYSLPTKNDDGTWMPGEWMPAVDPELCESGYHVCKREHVLDWLGPEMYEAEGRGAMVEGNNKVAFEQVRLTRKVETWDDRTARLFAVWCAREALKLVDNPDPRSVAACDVAERYANGEATQDELSAAWAAARDAARDAARAAAWAAAWDAARAAAWAAARAAARDAARERQINKLFELLEKE